MTWVERYVGEDGDLWAVVHSPQAHFLIPTCVYGEPFRGVHGHLLDDDGYPTPVLCAWEDD